MSSSSGDGSGIDDVDQASDSDTPLSAMERLKATCAPPQDHAAVTSRRISEKQKNDFISHLVSSASLSGTQRNTKGTSTSTSSKAKGKRKCVDSTSISSTVGIAMSMAHDGTKRNLKRAIVSNTGRKMSGRQPKDPVCGLFFFTLLPLMLTTL
jgi:hypothetical protein